ncbi:MAG: hypothetical protein ACFCVE_08220 [Phycisphaerae bacterium]
MPDTPVANPRTAIRRYLPAALVLAAVLLTLWPLLGSPFVVWDDNATIRANPNLNPPDWQGLSDHWTDQAGNLYIPVTYTLWHALAVLSYVLGLLDAEGTMRPWLFNAANLALHAGSSLLVLSLLRVLGVGRWTALAGALLFGVHPLQVESVGWASGFKDCLFVFLSLSTLRIYLAGVSRPLPLAPQPESHSESPPLAPPPESPPSPSPNHWPALLLAAVFFALSLLSKPTAVVVPIMLLVLERFHLDRPWRHVVPAVTPFVLLTLPVAYITTQVQQSAAVENAEWFLRPLVALDALGFYITKLVLPMDLTVIYGRTPRFILNGDSVRVTWLLVTFVAFFGTVMSMRRHRIGLGLMLAVIPLLPILGFKTFDMMGKSLVADHYMLLPMFGVALAAAALLPQGRWTWKSAVPVVAALVVLGLLAHRQTAVWQGTVALFEDVRQKTLNDYAGRSNLAVEYLQAGRLEEAEQVIMEAAAVRPQDTTVVATIAYLRWKQGDLAAATDLYRESIQLRGRFAEEQPYEAALDAGALGVVYDERADKAQARAAELQAAGDAEAARAEARKAAAFRDDARFMLDIAVQFARRDKFERNLGNYLFEYGRTLFQLGDMEHALAAYEEAAAEHAATLQPGRFAQATYMRGFILVRLNRLSEAEPLLARAVRLDPQNETYRRNHGFVAEAVGTSSLTAPLPAALPPGATAAGTPAAATGAAPLTLLPTTLAAVLLAWAAVQVTRRRPTFQPQR